MGKIAASPFRVLADHMEIYRFMAEVYQRDWGNGPAAPFWEYALASDWMDKSFLHRCRIWRDGEKTVGFCFYEDPVSDVLFSLRPGYEALAREMIAYAGKGMPCAGGCQRLVLFGGQAALIQAAKQAGYIQTGAKEDLMFDFGQPLDFPLPEGFRFTGIGGLDTAKAVECCWKGFGHEKGEGPWNGICESGFALAAAPHATFEYALGVEGPDGRYACYAGMWWVPENSLAYMEPLCTVPEYRGRGLARAALSELYRRMKPLGATHMTGGSHPFYKKIGYGPGTVWTYWEQPGK